jgi:drug/metabolite transporter (DMT)-like permease
VIALIGFVSGVVYGGSDFLGGLASKRMSPLLVTVLGNAVAAVAVLVALLLTPHTWSTGAVVAGMIAGVGGALGTAGLYACLAMGPMSVLSPTVAALYAAVPAVVGIALGERFGPVGYVALVVVFLAGLLLAATPESSGARLRPRALLLAAGSGLGFALYIIAMDRAPEGAGFTTLLTELLTGIVLFSVVLAVRRIGGARGLGAGLRDRRTMLQALGAGALAAVANLLLVWGLQLGDLAVMSVLNSLYPLGTVLLAIVILRERLTLLQGVGIALALGGAVVLGLS